MSVLIGVGALLAGRRGRAVPVGLRDRLRRSRRSSSAPGRLGADVGGVITLGAGRRRRRARLAAGRRHPRGRWRSRSSRRSRRVAALALIDLVTGGDAHLTPVGARRGLARRAWSTWSSGASRSPGTASGRGRRRSASACSRPRSGLRRRAPAGRCSPRWQGDRAFAAGMWGALAATVVGALANDSGPDDLPGRCGRFGACGGIFGRKDRGPSSNLARCA